jgi:hypothetical protein
MVCCNDRVVPARHSTATTIPVGICFDAARLASNVPLLSQPLGRLVPGPASASADEEWFSEQRCQAVGQSVTKLKAWRAQSKDILCES